MFYLTTYIYSVKKIIQFSLLSIAASCGTLLHATPYQLKVNAQVYAINGSDWDSSVSLGTTMTAVFNFDTDLPASLSTPTLSGYLFSAMPASITVGNYTATSTDSWLVIYNDDPFGEGYQFDGYNVTGSLPTTYFNYMGGRLWSSDFSLLANTDQPVQEFDPTVFSVRDLFIGGFTDASGSAESGEFVFASIKSYEVTGFRSVPEVFPVGGMLGTFILALALFRRRLIQLRA